MSAECSAENIPPGYKQTEVGVIPEDWTPLELQDACERIAVGLATSVTKYYRPSGVPIIRNLNIKDGFFDGRNMLHISIEFAKANMTKVAKAHDVLTVRTGANLGDTCVLPESFDNCQTFTTLITTPMPSVLSPHFLCLHMSSFLGKKEMAQLQVGGGKDNLNTGNLKHYLLGVPPLPEQQAIAKALYDMNAFIESLEQLIVKKRQIKQGAMQELLTGKRRLPGFSGEWEKKHIGDVLTIAHGKSQHAVTDRNGIYPILATGGQIGTANSFLYDKPSVLIGRKGTIDKPQYMDKPFWTVDTLFYSVIHEPNNAKFLFYRFCLIDWKQHNEASGVPSLNARTIESIELKIPSSAEQNAIDSILSDMDSEITTLEEKLVKTRQLKQGMMQELLTGRVRLI